MSRKSGTQIFRTGVLEFKFTKGHIYTITSPHSPTEKECIFQYEGKKGKHHMFLETRGKWTRCYTDVQLIGKEIEEVL